MTGLALGHVLCAPTDTACRSSLFAEGVAVDSGFVTVHGEQYAAAMVFDCSTNDGRHLVVETSRADDASYFCASSTGASMCSCVGMSRR